MMCPDHGAVDHVGRAILLYHLGECLQQGIKHAHLHPAPIAPEHAVPLPVFVWQQTPLRARPRHPHHAFEVAPVVASGSAAPPMLGRQQRANQSPLIVRNPDPLTQRCLQKTALNQLPSLRSSFVHKA